MIQFSFEKMVSLCIAVGIEDVGVQPSMKQSQNHLLKEIMRLFQLGIRNVLKSLYWYAAGVHF